MQRISADDALNHEWFREVPLPKTKDFMPTFPALNEQDRYWSLLTSSFGFKYYMHRLKF